MFSCVIWFNVHQ